MSLVQWIFSRVGFRATGTSHVARIAKGRGYTFEIVGESQYQSALDQIAGPKTPQGASLECVAELVPDDRNEHDAEAIAVRIRGQIVGFVPRKTASDLRVELARINPIGGSVGCYAKIGGGWRADDGDEGSYGVKISLSKPIRVEPAS